MNTFVKAIPSMLTISSLTMGLVALAEAFEGRHSMAALLVLIGMVLDGLDGRAARFFHAESHFGKELDSLSDIITFGVAPALIMYQVVLQYEGAVGMAVAVLFPVSGALRLARFNVQKKKTNYFVGLPITAAGGILATMALYYNLLTPSRVILPIGMVLLSVLMVSKARYPNFKKVHFPRSAIFVVPVLTVVIYVLFRMHVSLVNKIIFVPLALYAVFGIGRAVRRRRKFSEAESLEQNQDLYKSELK